MNNIITFKFDSHTIRTITEEDGSVLFNANDVCDALEFSNSRKAIADHVGSDDVTRRDTIDALGRVQQSNFLTEPGLYALVLRSNKPEAKRLQKWVTGDVLPSIRRTGSYAAPSAPAPAPQLSDKVQALLAIGEAMKMIPGVNPSIAMAATLNCITENTGLSTEQYRNALPSPEKISAYNATDLGKLISVSAREMNLLLERAGFQFKNKSGEWQMTEKGAKYGEAVPFSKNGHSSYQPKWHESAISALKEGGHLE